MKKFALISVSDKTGIVEFAKKLVELDYEIIATGNTARLIKNSEIKCTEISNYTEFPEIFSGRVKTLHPKIFGGILFRRDNENDLVEANANGILPIDIIVVNLYPFPQVVNRTDVSVEEKIENIDIGGPSLIRAAAKNYKFISVLTSPSQYDDFLNELLAGEIGESTRIQLASKAFAYTSYYDTLIANYFEKEFNIEPKCFRMNLKLHSELRYGENPHQKAKIYGDFYEYFDILHGKEISYNNIVDLTAAYDIVCELEPNSCVIVKHTNPCGAASSNSILDAYLNALSGDPVSAFGGIVAFNGTVDSATAEKLNEIFLEIVIAPEFDVDALEILMKKKNRRIVKSSGRTDQNEKNIKNIPGGLVVQDKDNSSVDMLQFNNVTKINVTKDQIEDLKFAWVICKHTKSNAIVYAKNKKLLGVGAGQMSRVDSARLGAAKAKENGHDLTGAVAASDAFFPFADGLNEIIANGITSVIQPGGSVRDQEVIDAADKNNLSMIFTGIRNFKH
ncbi:MAG: bifunctional phosphoribosylaminoimidazolecarboxamide formyltransferase/IMP cyclohydrolase [bacterium]